MRFDIQRADFWKRISAFLFDTTALGVVILSIMTLLFTAFRYDDYARIVEQVEKEYVEEYGIKEDITTEEFAALSEEEKEVYYACDEARKKDHRLIASYQMLSNLQFALPSVSILLGCLITEFAVPLFFKNGQTLGKKVFGIGVIHTNGIRMRNQAHFIRSIVGKCLIELLVPFWFFMMVWGGKLHPTLGIAMMGLMLLLEIFSVFNTRARTRSTIHDLVSDTVVVDFASQMVFETVEDLMEYKTRIHEEEVKKQRY